MSKQLNIHLFNCDRTYKLNVVEDWLKAVADSSKVVSHYFSLSEMTQLSDKTIPELEMDVAVFVVHAHESRLSINEENAGIGYAKLYRALLEKTGREVLIVIGGDDNYKNQDEEDREFISQWAKRKVSSQFAMDFLDGSRSFIFSWDKKHREIHEKALKYFFDPTKKGKKFEYHPPQRKAITKSETPPSQRAMDPMARSRPYNSLPEKSSSLKKTHIPSCGERDQRFNSGPGIKNQAARPQKAKGSAMLAPDPLVSAQDKFPSMGGQEFNTEGSGRHGIQKQGAKPIENASFTTGTQEGLAVIGCSVSEKSIYAVLQEIESIRPKLNIPSNPSVKNLSPVEAKEHLEKHSPQFCVLVVDGETIKDTYENLFQRRDEYEDLLKTAVEKVVNKVIILVCDDVSLPEEDEQILHNKIKRTVEEKGFIAWLKDGKLTVGTDVLAQVWNPALTSYMRPENSVQGQINFPSISVGQGRCSSVHQSERKPGYGLQNVNIQQQDKPFPPAIPTYTESNPLKTKLVLKSILRYGRISYDPRDVQFSSHELQEISDDNRQSLLANWGRIPAIQVRIIRVPSDYSQWVCCGLPEIEMADNELVVLKTRVRKGVVSFDKKDLEFCYPGWTVPTYISEDLKRKEANGKLFVIANSEGNLRRIIQSETMDKLAGAKDTFLDLLPSNPLKKKSTTKLHKEKP